MSKLIVRSTNALLNISSLDTKDKVIELLLTNDDLLKYILILFRDYAENHISTLSHVSVTVLYINTFTLLNIVNERLQRYVNMFNERDNSVKIVNENESQYKSEIILILLQFLNHVSVKDFLLEDDDSNSQNNSQSILSYINVDSTVNFEVLVSHVLLHGLTLIVSIISSQSKSKSISSVNKTSMLTNMMVSTAEFLRSYPDICEQYYSFTSYILTSYELEFAELAASKFQQDQEYNSSLLSILTEHLLWSVGGIDSIVARSGLQV